MKTKALLFTVALLVSVTGLLAQAPPLEFPAPSPACTLKQRVGLTDIEIVYSRPSMKGRPIFGGLVPYGEVWRTGANNATKITFSTAVKLNGTDVPAGTYALFTIPGEDQWTIIINNGAAQWGAFQYDQKVDVARFTANPVKINEHIESFGIDFNRITDDSAMLELIWDDVVVPIRVRVDIGLNPDPGTKTVPRIEAALSGPGNQKPYYQAAMYYYDHDLDTQKAKEWIDAALAQREAHYMVYLKAKILARLGDKDGAIAAANHSKELAIKAKDNGYVKLNDELIASLK